MDYTYIKALHIIFVVTWFAGLFYMPRLFIYNIEANEKDEVSKKALQTQFKIMMKRLWFGITWPSAIITLIFGLWTLIKGNWYASLGSNGVDWLVIKLLFVAVLYVYHYTLHVIFKQQMNDKFVYSSQQLRIWNEAATVLLVAIVMLVVVKQSMSFVWGITGIVALILALMIAIKVYAKLRKK